MKEINFSDKSISFVRDIRTAGILSGIYKPQISVIKSRDELYSIIHNQNKKKIYIPVLIPSNNKQKKFFVEKELIAKRIFNSDENYLGVNSFFSYGNYFDCELSPDNKRIKQMLKHTLNFKGLLKLKKKKNKSICAFQTRNIPHLGHEEIINFLSKKFDLVIINPVIGKKKKGDIKSEVIESSYNFLINNFLNSNIIYQPIISDMYYAGPLEAAHHALIRENLGFTDFIIGRDHAGAAGQYKPDAAIEFMKKERHNFKINIHITNGAYYCSNCKKITLENCCNDFEIGNSKIEISGSNLRKSFKTDDLYPFCRKEIHNFIKNKYSFDIYL